MGNDSNCFSCEKCRNRNYTMCDDCSAYCCVDNMKAHNELFKLSEEFSNEVDVAGLDVFFEQIKIEKDLRDYYGIYLVDDLKSEDFKSWENILYKLREKKNRIRDSMYNEQSNHYYFMDNMKRNYDNLKQEHQNKMRTLKQKLIEEENLLKNSISDNDNRINLKIEEKKNLIKVMNNISSKKESIINNYEKEEISKADLEYKKAIQELDNKYIFKEDNLYYTEDEIKLKNQYLNKIQKIKDYSKNPFFDNFINSFGLSNYLN